MASSASRRARCFDVDGFGQMKIESVFRRVVSIAGVGRRTDRDQHHVSAVRLLAKLPGDVAAVHRPRTHVDNAHVRADGPHEFQRAANIGRVVDQMSGELEHGSQSLSRVPAVFDQEHASLCCTPFMRECRRDAVAWRGNLPQSDGKRTAASFSVARRGDRAAVQLDEVADEGEADPEAVLRVVQCPIDLDVHVEDGGQQRRRDAETGVLDAAARRRRPRRAA